MVQLIDEGRGQKERGKEEELIKVDRNSLIAELKRAGVKHNPDDILLITKKFFF